MRLQLAYVSPRRDRLKSSAAHELVQDYVARAARFTPVTVQSFGSEEDLMALLHQQTNHPTGRARPYAILLDSRGRPLTSEQFAYNLRDLRDTGTQDILLAIGPANGWSPTTRQAANLLLSLGPMTLPHELALVLLAEQTYRALTILANHPYHTGHE